MDEFIQGIFSAATRAAEDHRSSCPFQCKGAAANITMRLLINHFLLLVTGRIQRSKAPGAGMNLQTRAFYAIWQRFARGYD
jgi:D-alanyl-lipoteichoic acid acyltransferase DltB (MBOAT superfamily)